MGLSLRGPVSPLQGERLFRSASEGVALGYIVAALQAGPKGHHNLAEGNALGFAGGNDYLSCRGDTIVVLSSRFFRARDRRSRISVSSGLACRNRSKWNTAANQFALISAIAA